jgi:LysM repeat protein
MFRFKLFLIAVFFVQNIVNAIGFDTEYKLSNSSLKVENADGVTFELDNENARIYIEKFTHIALVEMERSGIPASIKMAQGILESGAGMSDLARLYHNHFGIKCGKSWQGKTFYMWDDDVTKSCFRVFNSDEDSYIAHSEFIANPGKNSRYGFLFNFNKMDYKSWANGLQKAGYATSKTYAINLISIIERYELYRLDYLSLKHYAVEEGEFDSVFSIVKPDVGPIVIPIDTVFTDIKLVLIPDPFGNRVDSVVMSLNKSVFRVNGSRAMYYQIGDNLKKLSKRSGLSEKKLKKFNELPENYKYKAGQLVFLEKKQKIYTGKEKFHVVSKGQTLYNISQNYGLRYKSIIKLNKIYKDKKPAIGTAIRLQKEAK